MFSEHICMVFKNNCYRSLEDVLFFFFWGKYRNICKSTRFHILYILVFSGWNYCSKHSVMWKEKSVLQKVRSFPQDGERVDQSNSRLFCNACFYGNWFCCSELWKQFKWSALRTLIPSLKELPTLCFTQKNLLMLPKKLIIILKAVICLLYKYIS